MVNILPKILASEEQATTTRIAVVCAMIGWNSAARRSRKDRSYPFYTPYLRPRRGQN